MKISTHTTGGDASSLNGKGESTNKTLGKFTRVLPMNFIHNIELFCLACQYYVWIVRRTENSLSGDVPYLL